MLLNTFTLDPFVTVSEANVCEHWRASYRRHRAQKFEIKFCLKALNQYTDQYIKIKLIRISPYKLDKDENLPMAFKYIKDAIAEIIYPGLAPGRADDTELIAWEYDQEKGKVRQKAIRIEIYEQ
jgi:hypothetical protein